MYDERVELPELMDRGRRGSRRRTVAQQYDN